MAAILIAFVAQHCSRIAHRPGGTLVQSAPASQLGLAKFASALANDGATLQ